MPHEVVQSTASKSKKCTRQNARWRDLYADVYRPDAEGRFPVILLRLPVREGWQVISGDHEYFPARLCGHHSRRRGRFASEGEYYPLITEGFDGYRHG
jgi:predicted acyl esterase